MLGSCLQRALGRCAAAPVKCGGPVAGCSGRGGRQDRHTWCVTGFWGRSLQAGERCRDVKRYLSALESLYLPPADHLLAVCGDWALGQMSGAHAPALDRFKSHPSIATGAPPMDTHGRAGDGSTEATEVPVQFSRLWLCWGVGGLAGAGWGGDWDQYADTPMGSRTGRRQLGELHSATPPPLWVSEAPPSIQGESWKDQRVKGSAYFGERAKGRLGKGVVKGHLVVCTCGTTSDDWVGIQVSFFFIVLIFSIPFSLPLHNTTRHGVGRSIRRVELC